LLLRWRFEGEELQKVAAWGEGLVKVVIVGFWLGPLLRVGWELSLLLLLLMELEPDIVGFLAFVLVCLGALFRFFTCSFFVVGVFLAFFGLDLIEKACGSGGICNMTGRWALKGIVR
jgi:hypothetical protein